MGTCMIELNKFNDVRDYFIQSLEIQDSEIARDELHYRIIIKRWR